MIQSQPMADFVGECCAEVIVPCGSSGKGGVQEDDAVVSRVGDVVPWKSGVAEEAFTFTFLESEQERMMRSRMDEMGKTYPTV